MAYAMRKKDYSTGTQLNLANYNSLFPLFYFDVTNQTKKDNKRSQTADFQIWANRKCNVVLYELKKS